ncbi:putative thiosulfate sulfurtransferase [bacterium BMS3Abin02]|nr:putative thiosulfate sulfurtransferase [bacterium BMS3Abin02]GBE21928.1 putative thiosulfate sulfurtransferase [bacterium BMS3Bbin01]HDH25362.1 sulfurtransferase [Actinomycetota bacterium]HDK45065.1 sulfurtransferase [Actinomycetota bacterium]
MSYANPDALVSTEWLERRLGDPRIRILEVAAEPAAYEQGHLPGATFWSGLCDLQRPEPPSCPDQAGLSRVLSRAGVDDTSTVVVYGGPGNWLGAFGYWLLKYRGFDDVHLLDGGREKWQLEARPLTREIPSPRPTGFRVTAADRHELRANRDHVLAADSDTVLVDTRSPQEYRGEQLAPPNASQHQGYAGGHIPGARNIPWPRTTNADRSFRSSNELRSLFERESVPRNARVVTYSLSGARSAHTWFVLKELLGYPRVMHYERSWVDYAATGAPVERGQRRGESANASDLEGC